MHIEWRDIPGFEGYYQASNTGQIRSLDRVVNTSAGTRVARGRVLKQKTLKSGYRAVNLSKNGKYESFVVHRLVASAFLVKQPDMKCVDHINSDRADNRVSNLRWCTQQMNLRHSNESCRWPKKWRRVKRSDGEVFESAAAAARYTGVTKAAVLHHLGGDTKTCGGYTFEEIH